MSLTGHSQLVLGEHLRVDSEVGAKQLSHATRSDEEVYLSDPPSDLDATTKSDDVRTDVHCEHGMEYE